LSPFIRRAWFFLAFAAFCYWRAVESHEGSPPLQPNREALLWLANLVWPKSSVPAGPVMQPIFAPWFTEENLGLLFGMFGIAALISVLIYGGASRRAGEAKSPSAAVIALALVMSVLFFKQLWWVLGPIA
jgi:hypothetical protein